MKSDELFEQIFCSSKKGLILNSTERALARFIYCVAVDEIRSNHKNPDENDAVDDTIRKINLNKEIEATVKMFKRVVKLFKETEMAKRTFLNNFGSWSTSRKKNINNLRKIADDIQTDKFNCDVSKVVGSTVGIAGGVLGLVSMCTPLAAVTVPLAIGGGVAFLLGSGVIVGTVGTEIILLKKKLGEAKALIVQERKSFQDMAKWFDHTKEFENAIESVVDYSLMKELAEDVQKFLGGVTNVKEFVVGFHKKKFGEVLKMCMGKMSKLSNVKDTYVEIIALVIMTFVTVATLLRVHNKRMLDCSLKTHRLALGLMSTADNSIQLSQLIGGFAGRVTPSAAAAARIATMGIFVTFVTIMDVLNVVLSFKNIHAESKHSKKIEEVAGKLEQEFLFIERVYNELKNK